MSNYSLQPYSRNKKYYNILIAAGIVLITSNGIIINFFNNYLEFIGKTWELISVFLVIIVTYLYWFVERKSEDGDLSGKEIIDRIKDNGKKKLVEKLIWGSNFILIGVSLINIYLISTTDDNHWIGTISVLLVAVVYFLYCWIGDTVVDILKDMRTDEKILKAEREKISKVYDSVLSGYRYADVPILITFIILSGFAILFSLQIELIPEAGFEYDHIKLFFSGATGFQLIFSAITWANV